MPVNRDILARGILARHNASVNHDLRAGLPYSDVLAKELEL